MERRSIDCFRLFQRPAVRGGMVYPSPLPADRHPQGFPEVHNLIEPWVL